MSTFEPGTVEVNADLWALIKSPAGKVALRVIEADRGFATRCWITDYCLNEGYATVKFDGKMRKAHRVTYEAVVGEVPAGLVLDHLCRVRECVNPRHLEPVTRRINSLRGEGPTAVNARADRCSQGHLFTPDNTMRRSDGGRRCRTCNLAHQRSYNSRRAS